MTILQLLNIAVWGLFCGILTSHFAKKRGANQQLWFFLGVALGLLGLAILLLLPKAKAKKKPTPLSIAAPPKRTDAHLKRWYYLDAEHKQVGPMEFTDLTKILKEKSITKESFIWGEGMSEWKKVQELPDLEKEIAT